MTPEERAAYREQANRELVAHTETQSRQKGEVWGSQQSAGDPTQTNKQRVEEMHKNYYLGGDQYYAPSQILENRAAGKEAQSRLLGVGQQFFDAGNQAMARDSGRFVSGVDVAQSQGARGGMQDAYSGLMGIAQGPSGPSAAAAQLQMARDQTLRDTMSMARSGRGAGESATALQGAMMQNAATSQQTNQGMALLRAEEEAKDRALRLGAYQSAGGLSGAIRQGDLATGSYKTEAQLAAERQADAAGSALYGYGLQGTIEADRARLGYGALPILKNGKLLFLIR